MKIKKQIEKFINKIKYFISLVKTLHNKLKQLNINDLKKKSDMNPYQACFSWLLETLVYGLLITIVINSVFGLQGTRNLGYMCLGIFRWLIIDFINELRGN